MEASDQLETRLATRLRQRRVALDLTLDRLADRAGVSRAMISRIERGEASPTAALLGRLANALGLTLSVLFADDEVDAAPIARAAARPVWTDPDTGYTRRAVSPATAPIDLADALLPPGARIAYDNKVPLAVDQLIWVLDGELTLQVGDAHHHLVAGDCLHMRLDRPSVFENASALPVRYAVILAIGGLRHDGGR